MPDTVPVIAMSTDIAAIGADLTVIATAADTAMVDTDIAVAGK